MRFIIKRILLYIVVILFLVMNNYVIDTYYFENELFYTAVFRFFIGELFGRIGMGISAFVYTYVYLAVSMLPIWLYMLKMRNQFYWSTTKKVMFAIFAPITFWLGVYIAVKINSYTQVLSYKFTAMFMHYFLAN